METNYFRARINTLIPNKPTTFDLYLKINNQLFLYLRNGDKLDKKKIDNLKIKDSGTHFYIKEEDRLFYRAYVQDQMNSDELEVKEKAIILRESAMSLIEEMFENPDVNKALETAKPVIGHFMDFMKNEPEAMSNLISLSGHDFYTYNHSLDVSIYSLGLGEAMGFTPKELEEMGIGALFHDIGKRHVNLGILCKKGPLDDEEWTQMQRHPHYGLLILNENTVSDAVKAICFEHHESYSGNGYPQQLVGTEIHPFARIAAIADTYDALTTQRSYNVPMKPFDAITMMKEKLSGRFDPDMLKAMYSVLFRLKGA